MQMCRCADMSRNLLKCMYICMYLCMYVSKYVCMYRCMHACMHVCMVGWHILHACIRTNACTYIRIHTYKCTKHLYV